MGDYTLGWQKFFPIFFLRSFLLVANVVIVLLHVLPTQVYIIIN